MQETWLGKGRLAPGEGRKCPSAFPPGRSSDILTQFSNEQAVLFRIEVS